MPFCSGAAGTVELVLAGITAPFVPDGFSVWDRTVISVDVSCLEFAVCDAVESTVVAEITGVSAMEVAVFTSPKGFESSSSGDDIVGSGPYKMVTVNQWPVLLEASK